MTAPDQDYLAFWQLSAPVFLRPCAPQELFRPSSLRPLLDRLLLFCRQQQPLILILGEPGCGKSTLLRWVYDELSSDTHDVLLSALVRRESTATWLTARLAEFMGLSGTDPAQLLPRTVERMDELIAEKRKLVVILDAAHQAEAPHGLAEIAALLNLQSLAGSCLSFILCGDSTLAAQVAATPELTAKVAMTLVLSRLSRDETEAYLDYRLRLAGLAPAFEREALDLLHHCARGRYGIINSLAENALVEASHSGQRRITEAHVQAAAKILDLRAAAAASATRPDLPPVARPYLAPEPAPLPELTLTPSAPTPLREGNQDPFGDEGSDPGLPTPFKPAPAANKSGRPSKRRGKDTASHSQPTRGAAKGDSTSSPTPSLGLNESLDAATAAAGRTAKDISSEAADSASIKLSSLFKSDSGGSKP